MRQAAKLAMLALVIGVIGLIAPRWEASAQQYEVLRPIPPVRGYFWVSDGPGLTSAENNSANNRFRLGLGIELGNDHRFTLGWTILDQISSGETSSSVGDIARSSSGPNLGYYFIPYRLWMTYTFDIESVTGSRVTGSVTTYGHQLGLGYRIYDGPTVNFGTELTYLYSTQVSVPVLDAATKTVGSANYPSAQIWNLNLLLGVYFQ